LSEEEQRLDESVAKLGRLVPIIKDAHGNIIDGLHRQRLDPKWAEEFSLKLENIKDPVQFLIARMNINLIRRTVSAEEKTSWLKELKDLTGWSTDEIAEKTGMSKRWVLQYMPKELKEPEPEELARARLAREKIPEIPKEPQIEEQKPSMPPVPCSVGGHVNLVFPKFWQGQPVCEDHYNQLSHGEITLEPEKPKPEEAPKPSPVEKKIHVPGAYREEMHKPVSRMDQWLAEELSRRGIPIKVQEPVCIKFVVPEVIIEKGDKPLAVFLDHPDTHMKRTLADIENRELLKKRGVDFIAIEYYAYTEEERQRIISEVLSAIQ